MLPSSTRLRRSTLLSLYKKNLAVHCFVFCFFFFFESLSSRSRSRLISTQASSCRSFLTQVSSRGDRPCVPRRSPASTSPTQKGGASIPFIIGAPRARCIERISFSGRFIWRISNTKLNKISLSLYSRPRFLHLFVCVCASVFQNLAIRKWRVLPPCGKFAPWQTNKQKKGAILDRSPAPPPHPTPLGRQPRRRQRRDE